MSFIKQHKYIVLALAVLLIYLSPNIFCPNSARYLVHDNLNSNVVWYKNLAESGKMFAANQEIVPNSLGGIPRGCYPSEINIMHLLYCIFSPLTAYNINAILMHLMAFFSMYLFTGKYIFKFANEPITVLVSLVFALLPFWPSGGAAITAQPLLLYALLNILNKEKGLKNWLIVALIPAYSVAAFSNLFFVLFFSLAYLVYIFIRKKISWQLIGALALFAIATVIAEWRLFYMQFVEHFESHRNVLSETGSINLKGVLGISVKHFLKGHYHFISAQFPFILLSALLALVFFKGIREKKRLLLLLAVTFCISLSFVLPGWSVLSTMMEKNKLLSVLSLRFYSLFPLLWFLVYAYSSNMLVSTGRLLRCMVIAIGIASCSFLFFSVNTTDYYGNNYAENTFYNTYISKKSEGHEAFADYYKVNLFSKVKEKVKPEDGYVACLGFDPEVAQYNGFNTIDGYFYYYPKSYNAVMNEISGKEIEKTKGPAVGRHCILVCDDLKKGKKVIDNLELDFDKMKAIGSRYIFSRKKIVNERLKNEEFFEASDGRLYIYTIE